MSETETVTRRAVNVLPFTIEADHPRNSDLLIQCIPNCRLRSAISSTRHTIDTKTGQEVVPLDQSQWLATFPRTPGMRLTVDPANLSYTISDPMHGDQALCDRIRRFLKDKTGMVHERLDGVPTSTGTLDPHRMKSLCRELLNIVNAGEAKVVKGALPDLEDINDLEGHYLLNPGSRIQTTQPRFEKDFDSWVENLSRLGG